MKMLSLEEVINSEGKGLKNKVFRFIVRRPDGVKLKRYFQLLVKKYWSGYEEQRLLQIIDISKTVLYNKAKAKQQVLALMNATVSHEMRNPLNSILNQCCQFRFILEELKTQIVQIEQAYCKIRTLKDPKAIIRKLDHLKIVEKLKDFHKKASKSLKIQTSSCKLLKFLVSDILDFSRMKQNKFRKEIKEFNVQESVQEILEIQQY